MQARLRIDESGSAFAQKPACADLVDKIFFQQAVCSGNKIVQFIIYQKIITPYGLMFSLYGPLEGHCHDMKLFIHRNWNEVWSECLLIDGEWYYIFGDSAYLLLSWIQRTFNRGFFQPLKMRSIQELVKYM